MSITPAERYGEDSAISWGDERFGDVLPADDLLEPDVAVDEDTDAMVDAMIEQEEQEHERALEEATALVARVDRIADPLDTTGLSTEVKDRDACDRAGVDYEAYMTAFALVEMERLKNIPESDHEPDAEPSVPVGAKAIIESLHEERMKGMTDSEKIQYRAERRARASRNPRVG